MRRGAAVSARPVPSAVKCAARLAAFEVLYRAEADFVSRLARRLGGRPSDVADISQEVFLRVYSLLDDYDDSRSARPWLYAIVFRVVAERRRWGERGRVLTELCVLPSDVEDPERAAIRSQDRIRASRALQRIPSARRAVFVAHELEGWSIPEVAAQLEIPLNTAYSRLRVARGELAAQVSTSAQARLG